MTEMTRDELMPEPHSKTDGPPRYGVAAGDGADEACGGGGSARRGDCARAALHDFRQPIQSALAWSDLCRLYISAGDGERAMEALSRISASLAEIEDRAAPLVEAYVSTRSDGLAGVASSLLCC